MTRFRKVLIANRGEIAVRVARACADMGLGSVAVYADQDIDSLHVALADEAYALDGTRPADTYLSIQKLIRIAERSGADAVHPGYGFLSENADFAEAVLSAGLTWIGPDPATIRILGNKVTAREVAARVGAPLVAGSDGPVPDAASALRFAEEHGLPIAIKAAFGGGGRGLKVVHHADEVTEAFDSAVREAEAAFGRGECFVERYLDRPRHVEAQILADRHGTVIVAGTRDCSMQRRHQKLIEEAPAPFLTPEQRARLVDAAVAIAQDVGYVGAGTVEFLVSADGLISFLEVNTRLQVEHPVTEETSGLDLVQEQFRIAAGEPISVTDHPTPVGHSLEFRINAEDVGRGFLASPGRIDLFQVPTGPGIRVDSGVTTGSIVAPQFDSLIAKLIVTGKDRTEAIRRARRALDEFQIEGVATVLPFHRKVLEGDDFTATTGFRVHTRWIETDFADRLPTSPDYHGKPAEASARRRFTIELDGRQHTITVPADLVALGSQSADPSEPRPAEPPADAPDDAIRAPLSGSLVKWLAQRGDHVAQGEAVAVVEAMKMEAQVFAPRDAILAQLLVEPGEAVTSGLQLATLA